MKNKELNLSEILKGHESETFYCPMWGDTVILEKAQDGYKIAPKGKFRGYLNIGFDGKADEDGEVILFPSFRLYRNFPLDSKQAWEAWQAVQNQRIVLRVSIDVVDCKRLVTSSTVHKCTFASMGFVQQVIVDIKKILQNYQDNL
ncbi:MAG: hypothetical protein HDR92_05180 [Bacteroides sp.]|nr:hypothetical protein [Bacteroides sp.]